MWESGEAPAHWKLANVIPIDRGMREEMRNYRPTSLTSVLGKVMEKVVLGDSERQLKNKAIIKASSMDSFKESPSLVI